MKVLFLAPRLPLPADTGAKIRTFNLLKHMAAANQVTFLSFWFGDDKKVIKELESIEVEVHLIKARDRHNLALLFSKNPLSIMKYSSTEMKNAMLELMVNKKFDLIYFDHLHMGQYRVFVNNVPCVLDEHNVEALILERCANVEKNWAKRIVFRSQARKMLSFESRLTQGFSKCLTVSETDKQNLFKLSYGKANIGVIPNGVDTEFFKPGFNGQGNLGEGQGTKEENALVFTGSMDWLPNSDAVLYFCKKILPAIWLKNNNVKFYIVGKNPPKNILHLSKEDKRIIVTGLVDDVRSFIARSRIFVVPLRIGGGTRLKILEAMAMGKAVISTGLGAEGIRCTHNENILIEDEASEFAKLTLELLDNEAKRNALGVSARDLVCKNYDWKIISKKLLSICKELQIEK